MTIKYISLNTIIIAISHGNSQKINDIENCVAYITFILQFSICITARQCHLTNAVIHIREVKQKPSLRFFITCRFYLGKSSCLVYAKRH